jgi:hypothetical protein
VVGQFWQLIGLDWPDNYVKNELSAPLSELHSMGKKTGIAPEFKHMGGALHQYHR